MTTLAPERILPSPDGSRLVFESAFPLGNDPDATGAVDVFAVAFIPPSVKVVEVVAMVEMTDKYGNSKSEEGVTIALPRGEWEQVKDPAAFKDRIILDPTILYGIADSYQIHPGIYKNADDFSKTMPSTAALFLI